MLHKTLTAALMITALTSCTPTGQVARPQPPAPELVLPAPVEEPEPVKSGPVKVALLLPMSGNAAAVGKDLLNAALMAVFDVGPSDMILLPSDTGGTPEGARAAAQRAIDEEAELILGPLFASSTSAIAPLAREAGISVISFSNDNSIAGNGVYTAGFGPEEQVQRVIEFARTQGYGQVAAIGPDDIYGSRAMNAWRAVASGPSERLARLYAPDENGMAQTIRAVSNYDGRKAARDRDYAQLEGAGDPSSRARLAQLETFDTVGDPPFDALLVADSSASLRSVAALLTYYDVDPTRVKLLGTMLWQQDQRVLTEAELQGAWFATVTPESNSAFARRFANLYGSQPNALAGLAYDATAMAALIGRQDRMFPPELITDSAGFAGQAGIFRFRPDGTVEHGLAVVEVSNGGLEVLSVAPTSFAEQKLVQ